MEQSPSSKADSSLVGQKFSAFYGSRRFNAVFTRACHSTMSYILSQLNSIYTLSSCFF